MRTASVGKQNARSKVATTARPPWSSWRVRALDARCIKFIESQCAPRKGHGRGQPMKLAKFQKDWIAKVFGGDEIDASVLTLPRGQGKSTFGGGIGTWALYDEDVAEAFGGQPQIPVCAVALKQAVRGVYGAALSFVKGNPELMNRALIYSGSGEQRIVVPGNDDGELFPIAAEPDALQGLDPSLSLVDEIGFISIESWDSLLLAAGKRERSLTLGMGTRRPDNEPNALDHLVAQIEQHGVIERFHLVDIHADKGCDIDDRRQWRKANPAMAAGFLRESALESARKLSPESGFRTFRLNLKSESLAGWLGSNGPSVWQALRDPYTIPLGSLVWAGVDVSHHHDSTAVVHCAYRPDGRLHVVAKIWTPGPGKPIPFDEVEQHIRELSLLYRLQAVPYDPRYFAASAQRLESEGIVLEEIPQSHARMVPLIGETFRKITAGQLSHDADAAFTAHVLNAVPFFGDTTGFSLSKKKSATHIDACISMCLGVGASVFTDPEEEMSDDALRSMFEANAA